jgi:methanethiol S-methyltransferase
MRVYGFVVYGAFLGAFVYFIGWVEGLLVPRTIDEGPAGSTALAIVVDVLLLGVFAAQHSVMARPWFKRHWTRIVPPAAERSTYVLLATAVLVLLMWLWRPIPDVVWEIDPTAVRAVLYAVSFAGWGLALLSTFAIDHADMFGLSQVQRHHTGSPPTAPALATPLLYRVVRHPLYLGFLVAFWVAPTMSEGRLLFAAVMTVYVLMAVQFEERDLVGTFGDHYRAYRRQTPMLIPRRPKRIQLGLDGPHGRPGGARRPTDERAR